MDSKYILKTNKITRIFKKEKAVENLSLSIPENCIYGLLGANGAGKSTTLKMITGLIKPTSGELIFNGHAWSRKDLKDIGALIEQAPLYGNLNARENLKVHTTILGLPDTRIDEVLEIVDLEGTGKKQARNFSMGMKQRLGIAIAILNKPKLLILDEPTNGLDPIGIQELRKLIKSFPAQGMTVILSSHILSEVEQIVDYVGIMSHGVLGYEGAANTGEDLETLFMKVAAKSIGDRRVI
ncbi:lantibiotic protection ABC transporter ATP-binding protein [Clostridium oryzae]|uniref:Putative ABC transporter ATP-binding protein YxlF n=1 Tax=Clostridium oryzae TaxID=1450648 RepID=A0A1V4IW07_9CLOT|nr:lantibiotic protection ABC transporter ATP-binding protein [Clostridium oryzae]OPJ64221.1 putative ABC transporter ATP-binding protein YxlF [Clostridium oryzae]